MHEKVCSRKDARAQANMDVDSVFYMQPFPQPAVLLKRTALQSLDQDIYLRAFTISRDDERCIFILSLHKCS